MEIHAKRTESEREAYNLRLWLAKAASRPLTVESEFCGHFGRQYHNSRSENVLEHIERYHKDGLDPTINREDEWAARKLILPAVRGDTKCGYRLPRRLRRLSFSDGL